MKHTIKIFALSCLLLQSNVISKGSDSNVNQSDIFEIQTINKSDSIENKDQLPPPLKPSGGTIKVTSNRDNTRIRINNMGLGTTPFCRSGFQPGFYNIELHHDECRPFSKMVLIENIDSILIDAKLEPAGSLLSPQSSLTTSQSVITEKRGAPATPAIVQGIIIITCNIETAAVLINKVAAGSFPVTKTGLPGYYDIEIKKDGYKTFNKMVRISGNDTVRVQADLISELSRLIITSTPSNAGVFLNNKQAGTTPFDSSQITPAIYSVRLEMPGYVPVKKTVTLLPGITDTLSVTLHTIAYSDSVKKVRSRQSKTVRRILFGISTAGSVSALVYSNHKVNVTLKNEKSARQNYMAPGLSGYDYDKRYSYYKEAVKETDRQIKNRKAFTVLSIISAACFSFSIPF